MKKSDIIYRYKRQKNKKPERSRPFSAGLVFMPVMMIFGLLISHGNLTAGTSNGATNTPTPTLTPTPTFTPTPTPVILPSRLIIAKIGVNAHIENLGQDENNNMGIPARWEDVGWYELGVRPGEVGNAVIAGHLDTDRGAQAAFFRLGKLETGDTVEIVNSDGKVLLFRVSEKVVYPYDQVPKEYLFGTADSAKLILVTCKGRFNRSSRNYTDRIAVFAELI